jgi:hypothetical protein
MYILGYIGKEDGNLARGDGKCQRLARDGSGATLLPSNSHPWTMNDELCHVKVVGL